MKEVANYKGKYMVDCNGNIYTKRCKNGGIKKLKPQMYKNGYTYVDLGLNGKIKRHLIHRLVAEAYIKNINNKPQVNHINGNKSCNVVSNLEWATRSENQKHAILNGLRSAKGEKNSRSKLKNNIVIEIYKSKQNYKELASKYNVSISTISSIKNKKTWTHLTQAN